MKRLVFLPLLLTAVGIPVAGAQTVRIDRDAMGVPHVFGDTAEAVLFGAGYAEAQDRLADLEQARRRALGRLAEVLGPSAVQSDIVSRQRLADPAELMRMYRAIPAEYHMWTASSLQGVVSDLI